MALSQQAQRDTLAQREQQRQIAQQVSQALPEAHASNWDQQGVQGLMQRYPLAADTLLKTFDERRKSDSEFAYKGAQTNKENTEARTKAMTPITNIAFQLSNKPDLNAQDIAGVQKLIANSGLDKY